MQYSSAIESGWDDTPRYTWFNLPTSNLGGFIPRPGIDSVELNAWLHAYMETLADLSRKLQDTEGAQAWRRKAQGLAQRIESTLWSEMDKAWMDKARDGKFVQTLTPAVWFPAFLGVSRDEERIRSVIEEHLLNPEEFFGAYPIPTVAYNDPAYNHDGEGMYWRGQVWIVTAYSGLETLFRYGYEKEANELKQRLMGDARRARVGCSRTITPKRARWAIPFRSACPPYTSSAGRPLLVRPYCLTDTRGYALF